MPMPAFAALAALLMVPAPAAPIEGPTGEMILDNATALDADLLVDGVYQCHAPSHSSCVAEVPSGIHMAMIVFADGDFILSDPIDVPADMSMTLPVRDLTT